VFRTAVALLLAPAFALAQGIVTTYRPPVIPPGSPGSIPPLPGQPFPPLVGMYPIAGPVWYPWYSSGWGWNAPQVVVNVNPAPVMVVPVANRGEVRDNLALAAAEIPAVLKVQFPAPADVWVNGAKLDGPATAERDIPSAPIKLGSEYTFAIKARWTLSGTNYEVERTSTVPAGGSKKLIVVSGTPVK
jgi:hypothetical protein